MASNGLQPGFEDAPAFPEEDAPAQGADLEEVARFAVRRGNFYKGTTAARLALPNVEGVYWSDTDLDSLFRNSGSGWVEQPGRAAMLFGTSTSAATGADTKVDFDDPGTLPSWVTWNESTKEFTIQRVGNYRIIATGRFQTNANGFRALTVRKNGTLTSQATGNGLAGGEAAFTVMSGVALVSGDKITVEINQTSGVTLSFAGAQITLERI